MASDIGGVGNFIEAFMYRQFTLSDVRDRAGNALDRKLLYTWKERGLLPFDKPSGWSKFSFVELVWLRLVMELREFGLELEKIVNLKDYYFSDEHYIRELYLKGLANLPHQADDMIKMHYKGKDQISFEDFRADTSKEYNNKLLHHIVGIVLNRHNICLCLNSDGKIEIYELGRMLAEGRMAEAEGFPSWYHLLNERSMVLVNLTKIIKEISQTHQLFEIEKDQLILRQSAEALIKRLFTDKHIVEVTIRMTNREEPLVYIKRQLTFKELNQKINDLQRKGVFRDMTIKSRDGKVQYFESIDIIKL